LIFCSSPSWIINIIIIHDCNITILFYLILCGNKSILNCVFIVKSVRLLLYFPLLFVVDDANSPSQERLEKCMTCTCSRLQFWFCVTAQSVYSSCFVNFERSIYHILGESDKNWIQWRKKNYPKNSSSS
jgi:hypothetical protein